MCSSPLIISLAILWICSNRSASFLCWDPRAGCITAARVYQSGGERQNSLPCHAGHTALDVAQDMFGFLACKCALLGRVQSLIHEHHWVLLGRAALDSFSIQPLFLPGIALALVQDVELGLVNFMRFTPVLISSLASSLWVTSLSSSVHHAVWCHRPTHWELTQTQCPCHWQRC